MTTLCKNKDKVDHDAKKAAEHLDQGKNSFECKKCGRRSHKEDHLCKPKEISATK